MLWIDLRKRALQLIERENRHQLDDDVTLSAHSASGVTLCVGGGITFLIALRAQQPFSFDLGYELLLATLMLLAVVCLMLLAVCYGRYRTERTFWEYLLSLKRIPLSHWTTPLTLHSPNHISFVLGKRLLTLLGRRFLPQHRPKHKAPILLFQQAPLLLAP